MEHAIGYAITLRPRIKAEEFEAFFRKSVRKANKNLLEQTEFLLYRPIASRKELLWITRFPAEEFDRVNRAAIPFVLLAILEVLREVRKHFAGNITSFSSPVTTPQQLLDEWNEKFGRFTKLVLDPPS